MRQLSDCFLLLYDGIAERSQSWQCRRENECVCCQAFVISDPGTEGSTRECGTVRKVTTRRPQCELKERREMGFLSCMANWR